MPGVHSSSRARRWPAAALLASLLAPGAASAQSERGASVVPLLGLGVVRDGQWGSAGMEAGLELEYGADAWRAGALLSVKALGVGCSEACFDGGPAGALGVSTALGPLWLGVGAGAMRDFGSWHMLSFGRIAWEVGWARLEARVERIEDSGVHAYVPLLVGVPLPRRPR